jgi:sulfatase maturation enzyme AslB (radical SAM superfamily)
VNPVAPTVVIGTTNHCNARCVFCFRKKLMRPRGFMDDAMFERIVDEHLAVNYNLCLFGEPLLDPNLPERVAYVRSRHPKSFISFNTNGGLLTDELSDALVASGLSQINVSVYGITAKEHDRLQPPTKFEHIVMQVERLARRGLPVLIVTNRVEQLDGWNWKSIVRFWKSRGCEVASDIGFEWGDGVTRKTGSEPSGNQCLLTLGFKVFDWDGSFVTCCLDFNGANNFGRTPDDDWNASVAELKHRPCNFCYGCKWRGEFNKWRNDQ